MTVIDGGISSPDAPRGTGRPKSTLRMTVFAVPGELNRFGKAWEK